MVLSGTVLFLTGVNSEIRNPVSGTQITTALAAMRRRWGGFYLALAVGAAYVAVGTPISELRGYSPRPDAADTARGLDLGGSQRIAMLGGLAAQTATGASGNVGGMGWGFKDRKYGCVGGVDEIECEAGVTSDPLRLRGGAKQPKSRKRSHSRARSGSGAQSPLTHLVLLRFTKVVFIASSALQVRPALFEWSKGSDAGVCPLPPPFQPPANLQPRGE